MSSLAGPRDKIFDNRLNGGSQPVTINALSSAWAGREISEMHVALIGPAVY